MFSDFFKRGPSSFFFTFSSRQWYIHHPFSPSALGYTLTPTHSWNLPYSNLDLASSLSRVSLQNTQISRNTKWDLEDAIRTRRQSGCCISIVCAWKELEDIYDIGITNPQENSDPTSDSDPACWSQSSWCPLVPHAGLPEGLSEGWAAL